MAAMTNYLENKLVDHTFRGINYAAPTVTYAALLTNVPDDSTSPIEVTGGSYTRVAIVSNSSSWAGTQGAGSTTASTGTSATISNNEVVTFNNPTANWGTVVGIALYDAATGGNALIQGALTSPVTVVSGSPAPSFPASTFSYTIDNN